MNLKEKKEALKALVAEAKSFQNEINNNESLKTAENIAAMEAKLQSIKNMKSEVEKEEELGEAEAFINAPAQAKSTSLARVESRSVSTPGRALAESADYKSAIAKGKVSSGTRVSVELPDFNPGLKTVFTESGAGVTNGMAYLPGVVELGTQRLTVADLVARGTTTLGAVPYIKESSFANAATTVAENGEKPEATFATEEVIAPVKKIAVVGRVSDELFADYPAMQSYVDGRLRYMVAAKEEDQILNGNGTGSNLTGILNTSGVLFQNSATGTLIDNIHQAITKVRAEGFFEPDAIVIHPNDWQSLRLAKDNDDQYYSQGPFAQIGGNSIWGLPAVITTAIAEGTQLVGAFRLGAQLFYKNGVTVEASNSDGDDFTYNRMAIRVEERVALAVFRPTAFCAIYAD
jgi:HK97 family phage major capsid protein